MDLRTKRKLDLVAGTPALLLMRLLARGLGRVLGRDHSPLPARTLVVAKFQGVGSLAIAKPALEDLRRACPAARILFWGTPSTCALARLFPEIDEVIELDDGSVPAALLSLAGNLARLWALRPDWVFDLEVYSKLSSVLVTLSCARNRAGFAVEAVRLRRNSHTHLVMFNRYEYLGKAYRVLLALLTRGAGAGGAEPARRWRFDPAPLPFLPEEYAVINAHAGPLSYERRWPPSYFLALIAGLRDRYPGLPIALLGHGNEELDTLKGFPSGPGILRLDGKLSLEETIRCLAHSRLVVSGDSGPLHLALLGQSPVVALFGPTSPAAYVDPARPYQLAITERLYCSPCVHHWEPAPCGGDNQCMKRLSVERALAACRILLGDGSAVEAEAPKARLADPGYFAGLIHGGPSPMRVP